MRLVSTRTHCTSALTIAGFRNNVRIAGDANYGRMEPDADPLLIPAYNRDGRAHFVSTFFWALFVSAHRNAFERTVLMFIPSLKASGEVTR